MMLILALVGLAGCGSDTGLNLLDGVDPLPAGGEGPVAVSGAGSRIERDEEALLDGSESYDPDQDEQLLDDSWFVSDWPEGANYQLNGEANPQPSFQADTLGEYVISLIVTDTDDDLPSSNAADVAVQVVPYTELELTLTWTGTVDLDLHLVQPDGTYYGSGDCFFGNPAPDCGVLGDSSDDPILDRDDDSAGGPETIVLERPEEGVYQLYVQYYNDRGLNPNTIPSLEISRKGVELAVVAGPAMSAEGSVWVPGTLDWSTLAVAANESDSADALTTNEALGGPDYNQ